VHARINCSLASAAYDRVADLMEPDASTCKTSSNAYHVVATTCTRNAAAATIVPDRIWQVICADMGNGLDRFAATSTKAAICTVKDDFANGTTVSTVSRTPAGMSSATQIATAFASSENCGTIATMTVRGGIPLATTKLLGTTVADMPYHASAVICSECSGSNGSGVGLADDEAVSVALLRSVLLSVAATLGGDDVAPNEADAALVESKVDPRGGVSIGVVISEAPKENELVPVSLSATVESSVPT
jgi:hypothetical protein